MSESLNVEAIRGMATRAHQQIALALMARRCLAPRYGGCGTRVHEADERFSERSPGAVVGRWEVYLGSGLCAGCQIEMEAELAEAEEAER